jgi:putative transposase
MLIKKAFKYRLKPTSSQENLFAQFAGAARFIYNWGLDKRKTTYEQTGKTLSYFEQNNAIALLKKEEKTLWLQEIHSQVPQQALKNLDEAFKHFFRRVKLGQKPGFPRFKVKGMHDSFRFPQGFKVKESLAFLPKIGWVKFIKTREIEGEIKQATILREGDHWYISFSCEVFKPDPTPVPIDEEKAVGIDMGLKHFATLAIGSENRWEQIAAPKFLNYYLPRLKTLSKRLSKKTKGSKNWIKSKRQLSRLHAKIRHARENFAHQLSSMIVKSHDVICVESLNIINLIEQGTRSLSRAITDAAWRQFLRCLKYKALERGKHFVETGKFFPSTQTCSSCGNLQKMGLGDREYHCKACGQRIDRDLNSAIVEKAAGMSVLKACGSVVT